MCNSGINFIIRNDKKKIFHFTPLQSSYSQKLLNENQEAANAGDTFILFVDGKILHRSDAALKILMLLGGRWKLLATFYLFPKFIRNGIYNLIARNRYKWFGKENSCIIPSPEIQERFIL